jgi:shikimate dehydrogenase
VNARYAVFGHPIGHSLSPALHAAAFRARGLDATYEALDVTRARFGAEWQDFVLAGGVGANFTAPLKWDAFRVCDERTPEAQEAGAVNTIQFSGGRASGHNTDGIGFVRFLERSGVPPGGKSIVLLGGGGAAAGLTHALRSARARAIAAVVRDQLKVAANPGLTPDEGVRVLRWGSPEAQRALGRADVVVQSTPLGADSEDDLPCPPEWVGADALAVDLLYHPAETPWLAELRARGVRAANGLGLLVEQALFAQEFWFGDEPPRTALEEALPWKDPFTAPPHDPGKGSPASPGD